MNEALLLPCIVSEASNVIDPLGDVLTLSPPETELDPLKVISLVAMVDLEALPVTVMEFVVLKELRIIDAFAVFVLTIEFDIVNVESRVPFDEADVFPDNVALDEVKGLLVTFALTVTLVVTVCIEVATLDAVDCADKLNIDEGVIVPVDSIIV